MVHLDPRHVASTTLGIVVLALIFPAATLRADEGRQSRYRTHLPSRIEAPRTRTVHGVIDPAERGGPRSFARAPLDSFQLYGGPGSGEGDFETAGGLPDREGWLGVDRTDDGSSFAVGDFSKVLAGLSDLDPCAQNTTPQMTFVDDGSDANNRPGVSTGGVTSTTWSYGAPGGWVVNGDGGVGAGTRRLWNEVWSPPIELDDPGTSADDAIGGGLVLRYTAWMHLPLQNGIFHVWSVRSFPDPDANDGWSEWRDRGFLHYTETPQYVRQEFDVGDLLVDGAERVQIALGVVDLSEEFGLAGSDATPSPWIDDVELVKFTPEGPAITVNLIDTFHDGFAHSGAPFDANALGTQATRLDSGRDINPLGATIVTGDSMVVRVKAVVPGSALARPPRLTWVLRTNALFDPVRVLPPGAVEVLPGFWQGFVDASPSTDAQGVPVADTWFFDLPDGPPRSPNLLPEPSEPPLFFPGDRLWTFVEAEDTFGNVSFDLLDPGVWDPPNDGGLCGRAISRRAASVPTSKDPQTDPEDPQPEDPIPTDSLPGVWDIFGKRAVFQPRMLVWDDAPDLREYLLLELALAEIGILRGPDYDVYRTREPESGHAHGLGASAGHGATPAQIAGYDILVHLGGTSAAPLLSDGSNLSGNDKGNDIGLLTAWRQDAAPRTVITFADRLGSAMASQGAIAQSYLLQTMGVGFVDDDVSDQLGGTLAPTVIPSGDVPILQTRFALWGGCGSLARRDQVDARLPLGAVRGHQYSIDGVTPLPGFAASVVRDRNVVVEGSLVRRLDVSFAFALADVRQDLSTSPDGDPLTTRAQLLAEVLSLAGMSVPGGPPVSAPPVRGAHLDGPYPNPFNPTTTLALVSDRVREVTVAVFDTRGREVRTLHRGRVEAGRTEWRWDGRDARGASVSSGVYLLYVRGEGVDAVRKAVLAQ